MELKLNLSIVYQDNTSSKKLVDNVKARSGKRTKEFWHNDILCHGINQEQRNYYVMLTK